MKAILQRNKLAKTLVMFGVFSGGLIASFSGLSATAWAGDKRSEIGKARNLELYPKDAADHCVPGALQIRATINNVTKKGLVKAELFGEYNFLKKSGKLRRIRVPAEDGSVKICINLPAPGDFALVTYHDENGDRRLKKAWNYKPKEPYGISNNPKIKSLRIPKFSEARFHVPMEGIDLEINLVDLDD